MVQKRCTSSATVCNMSVLGWFSAKQISVTIGFTTLEALSLLALIHAVAHCVHYV